VEQFVLDALREYGIVGVWTAMFFWKIWPWITAYLDTRAADATEERKATQAERQEMAQAVQAGVEVQRNIQKAIDAMAYEIRSMNENGAPGSAAGIARSASNATKDK
jgi:hypothetical protein